MRWNLKAPNEKQPWVQWFAWYPVMHEDYTEMVFWEWVERKRCYPFEFTKRASFWIYRVIKT